MAKKTFDLLSRFEGQEASMTAPPDPRGVIPPELIIPRDNARCHGYRCRRGRHDGDRQPSAG